MGQINLPLLNRTGYSVFWDSCFDDTFNFSKSLHSSFFSKKVVKLFFKDRSSKYFMFMKKKKIAKLINMYYDNKSTFDFKLINNINDYLVKIESTKNFSNVTNFWKSFKSVPYYGTKVFFH